VPPRQAGSSESQTIRLSPTNAEPLASLSVSKVRVQAAGHVWLIPALDAAAWLQVLLDEQLDVEAIFPGFCGPDVIMEVNRLLISGELTSQDMEEIFFDVLEAASGRRWWITLRLCRFLRAQWDQVGGELAAHGVTPFGVSLSYWLDGAYATCLRLIKEADPKNLTKFTAHLTSPPPGRAKEAFDLEANRAAFRAAMSRAR